MIVFSVNFKKNAKGLFSLMRKTFFRYYSNFTHNNFSLIRKQKLISSLLYQTNEKPIGKVC